MKRISAERLLWALVLIVLGSIFFAQNMNLIDRDIIDNVWKLWPLFILVPGISALIRGKFFVGTMITFLGISFLISNFTNYSFWGTYWPLILIIMGLSIVFKPRSFEDHLVKGVSGDDYLNETVVFGGIERACNSKKFKGGKVDAVFGGGKVDLREVQIEGDMATIEINAIFGGLEVLVNTNNYKVVADGTGVFGGWVNKYNSSKKEKPVLKITGAAVFGGVEVKE